MTVFKATLCFSRNLFLIKLNPDQKTYKDSVSNVESEKFGVFFGEIYAEFYVNLMPATHFKKLPGKVVTHHYHDTLSPTCICNTGSGTPLVTTVNTVHHCIHRHKVKIPDKEKLLNNIKKCCHLLLIKMEQGKVEIKVWNSVLFGNHRHNMLQVREERDNVPYMHTVQKQAFVMIWMGVLSQRALATHISFTEKVFLTSALQYQPTSLSPKWA